MPNSTARRNARSTKPRHKTRAHTPAHGDHHNPHRTNDRSHNAHRADDRSHTSRRDDDRRPRSGDRETGTRHSNTWTDRAPRDRDGSRRDSWAADHNRTDHRHRTDFGGHQPTEGGNRRSRRATNPRTTTRHDGDHRSTTPQSNGRKHPTSGGHTSGPATHSRNPATTAWDGEIGEERPRPTVTFADLGLPTPLLRALAQSGIAEPFPIQTATLPDALSGRDVLGRAQTGSGKTLAFGLALLTRLNDGQGRPKHPRGLVLVPTRELAMQVEEALQPLAKSLGLWCRTVVGGMSFSRQAEHLRRGVDLLIATPGRLSDHVRQGTCVLDDVAFTTLDEADQMADMGFLPQVRAILDLVPDGQRMLFSATLDRDVAALVDRYLTDPASHSVSPPTATVSTMDHHLLLVSSADKNAVAAEMAARDGRTIMFLRTKHHVDRLTKQLRAVGVRAGALHGGKAQGARNRVLGEFKGGQLPVLVATDVAARGIHVDGISLVVHVDPPADAKGYLHRAGRTARAGESGTVVTLVTHQERRTVFRMTEQAGVQPVRTKVEPGHADLVRITGARTPSGDPVADPKPTERQTGRPSGRPTRAGRFTTRHTTSARRKEQRPGR